QGLQSTRARVRATTTRAVRRSRALSFNPRAHACARLWVSLTSACVFTKFQSTRARVRATLWVGTIRASGTFQSTRARVRATLADQLWYRVKVTFQSTRARVRATIRLIQQHAEEQQFQSTRARVRATRRSADARRPSPASFNPRAHACARQYG